MQRAEQKCRFQSCTQLTMCYYSQEKYQDFTVADATHKKNTANVIQSFHESIRCIKAYMA